MSGMLRSLAQAIMRGRSEVRRSLDSWAEPPAVALLATVTIAISAALLSRLPPAAGGGTFVESTGWRVWRGVASIGVAVWVVVGLYGYLGLRSAVRRSGVRLGLLIGMALGFCFELLLVVAVFAALQGHHRLAVPIQGWNDLIQVLLVFGAIVALPWVVRLWLLAPKLRGLTRRLRSSLSAGRAARPLLRVLSRNWREIEVAVVALALIVLPATLNTAAIRLAVVPTYVPESEFPESLVLLYGASFAVFIAWAVLPLVWLWRSTAVALVEAVLPLPESGLVDDTFLGSRSAMEQFLGLSRGPLKSPITTLSILTPLGTALLTTFIPATK